MKTDNQVKNAQDRLLMSICDIYKAKKCEIEKMKVCEEELHRPDFLWFYLLQSFGTMGRAGGAIELLARYQRISYEALAQLTEAKRQQRVQQICTDAHVRFPNRKAIYILNCFDRIHEMDGPETAKKLLLKQKGKDGKIEFLQSFPGIGPKYARNLMMDVYHIEFRNCIAIDSRIISISNCLGLAFTAAQYTAHEEFYLEVAKRAKLNGWELDRLLFNFNNEVKQNLGCAADRKTPKGKSTGCH